MSRILQMLVFAAALGSAPLRAQATDGPQPPPQTQTPSPAPGIDPTSLGFSCARARLQRTHPAPPKNGGLKIQETIQVVGVAPPVLFWDPNTVKATLTSQAVPY